MKKYLIYLIPGLLILNACTEGRSSLSEEQRTVLEDGLLGGQENSRDHGSTSAAAPGADDSDLPDVPAAPPPGDDGSHSVNPEAVPGQGPITVTPAFPPSGSNGGNHDFQASGPGFHFEQADPGQTHQFENGNVNLAAQADPDGSGNSNYQTTGNRPQVSEAVDTTVYDPFCNCYKTGPSQGLVDLSKVHKPENAGKLNQSYQATDSDEDDDD